MLYATGHSEPQHVWTGPERVLGFRGETRAAKLFRGLDCHETWLPPRQSPPRFEETLKENCQKS